MGIDCRLREDQAGFRSSRETTEQVFILCNILEQLNEWQAPIYIHFADLKKNFDLLNISLWMTMKQYWCSTVPHQGYARESERSVRENKPSVELQQRNEEDRDRTLQDTD